MILEGKRILVTGVVNRRSIAFAVAEQAQRAGAEVLLTSFGRMRSMTERAAKRLPQVPEVLELDVNRPDDFVALREELNERWGGIDGAVHAIAYAPPDALGGEFLNTPRESATVAFETSAFSLKALAEALLPLYTNGAEGGGGSLVGLDFDASVAWPAYDWMGVSKAALEAAARYLARDLGPHGVRVNLISAGPLATPAASGIPGFERIEALWDSQAPLGWDVRDAAPVADAIAFLLSDMSRGMSGEIVHVDGGFHAMGAPLARSGEAANVPS
ncbi:MAG: enoyl-ACP reductase FabI [Solirubrobacterales bacterium]